MLGGALTGPVTWACRLGPSPRPGASACRQSSALGRFLV